MRKSILFCSALLSFSFSVFAATFEGKWEKSCEPIGDGDMINTLLEISPTGIWTRERRAFEDANCQTPWIVFREIFRANDARASNLIMQQAFYLPASAEIADGLNLVAYCGFENWRASVWTEVTGKTCQDFQIPAAGQNVEFQIRFTEGNRPEEDRLSIEKDETPYHRHF